MASGHWINVSPLGWISTGNAKRKPWAISRSPKKGDAQAKNLFCGPLDGSRRGGSSCPAGWADGCTGAPAVSEGLRLDGRGWCCPLLRRGVCRSGRQQRVCSEAGCNTGTAIQPVLAECFNEHWIDALGGRSQSPICQFLWKRAFNAVADVERFDFCH